LEVFVLQSPVLSERLEDGSCSVDDFSVSGRAVDLREDLGSSDPTNQALLEGDEGCVLGRVLERKRADGGAVGLLFFLSLLVLITLLLVLISRLVRITLPPSHAV
jgi:hypothetical protein